ncbi:transposase [Sphingobacterium sp. SRCM116780]|uniref:transposase n=1 Tax=Sphingobacterium sp. SRCM116780 TaxID=2907623 RepID=UPI001F27B633|nr:transposase [Sphingobacterium sp. SRCM116780]UIR54602.1 transposase [Sphingobacterium sp. SRCM116780]UIR56893.1 transposase [Sphingobacterium sp. SRCM116780]UIR56994.1 transposase [Sphingobacterium sp. SRCM116780]
MSIEKADKKFGRYYLDSFKREVVSEVEREGNLALVCSRHGISYKSIHTWLKQYGSISYQQNKIKLRSLCEREGIAREIVSGHISIEEAMLKYNARNRDTVNMWIRHYKLRQQELIDLLPAEIPSAEREFVSSNIATDALKLAELKIRSLEIMLDIASKEFHVDIRKKFGAKP